MTAQNSHNNINCKNMVAFDRNSVLKKYNSVNDILNEFVDTRKLYYDKRKIYSLDKLSECIKLNTLKMRFIQQFIDGEIEIMKKSKSMIEEQLKSNNYPKIDGSYDYLLRMPIYNLTLEQIQELEDTISKKQLEHDTLVSKTVNELWLDDINILEKNYLNKGNKPFKFLVKKQSK